MRITIGTGYTKNFSLLGDYTRNINEAFANSHEHSFSWFSETLDSRPASWSKIPFAQKHLGDCDWFMWIDADACFVKPTKLEEFTSDKHFLVVQKGPKLSLNAGVWLIKNCEQAHDFLTEVYLPKYHTKSSALKNWWEQEAIHRIVKQPKFNDVKLLEYNQLWYNPLCKKNGEDDAPMAHCAGPHSLREKLSGLKQILK